MEPWRKAKAKEVETMEEEVKEIAEKNTGILRRMALKRGVANTIIQTYNRVCGFCKPKMLKNPKMPLDQYCAPCREIILEGMQKVKDRLR